MGMSYIIFSNLCIIATWTVSVAGETLPECSSAKRFALIFDDSIGDPDSIATIQDEFIAQLARDLRSTFTGTRVAVGVFSGLKSGFVESEYRKDSAFEQVIQDMDITQQSSSIKTALEMVESEVNKAVSRGPVSILFVVGPKNNSASEDRENEDKATAYFKDNTNSKGFVIGIGDVHEGTLTAIGGPEGSNRRWTVNSEKDLPGIRTEVGSQLCKQTEPYGNNVEVNCVEGTYKNNSNNCFGYLVCRNKQWVEHKCWRDICKEELKEDTIGRTNVEYQCTTAACFGYKFVPHHQADIYPKVSAAIGSDGKPMYICRDRHGPLITPGRFWEHDYAGSTKQRPSCMVPLYPPLKAVRSYVFDVLVNPLGASLGWVPGNWNSIPENPVLGGISSKELHVSYISRCEIQVERKMWWVPGALYQSYGTFITHTLKPLGQIYCAEKNRHEILACTASNAMTIREGTRCIADGTGSNEINGAGYFMCKNKVWNWVACSTGEVHIGAGICEKLTKK